MDRNLRLAASRIETELSWNLGAIMSSLLLVSWWTWQEVRWMIWEASPSVQVRGMLPFLSLEHLLSPQSHLCDLSMPIVLCSPSSQWPLYRTTSFLLSGINYLAVNLHLSGGAGQTVLLMCPARGTVIHRSHSGVKCCLENEVSLGQGSFTQHRRT